MLNIFCTDNVSYLVYMLLKHKNFINIHNLYIRGILQVLHHSYFQIGIYNCIVCNTYDYFRNSICLKIGGTNRLRGKSVQWFDCYVYHILLRLTHTSHTLHCCHTYL